MSHSATLMDEILEWKKKRNAVILAHNYQLAEVQDLADFSGDSLELSRKAESLDADVVVFCGVHFMAETAAILSPEKVVLLPDEHSGCPMADMIDAETLAALKEKHPKAVVVCYVNSTAEVKALSDVCCTSANAPEIVARIPEDREVLFVPDQYLGAHVERTLGRKLILFPGYCPTHSRIWPKHIEAARAEFPGAPVMVHPECRQETCLAADAVLSTGGMCRFVASSDAKTFIVGTEVGLLHRLRKENPDKTFVPLSTQAECLNMKKNTLEKILDSLKTLTPRVTVEETVAKQAKRSIVRMLHGYTPGLDEVEHAD